MGKDMGLDAAENEYDVAYSYIYPTFYKPEDGAPLVPIEGEIDYPFEDITSGSDENRIRGNWQSKVDYVVSLIAFTVAIRNVWMFPYHVATCGGAAFLLPYLLMLFFVSIPLFLMELSLGQFVSLGCVSVWKVCPLFKGIGIASLVLCCFIAVYQNMVSAWSLYYLVTSIRKAVAWATCDDSWGPESCAAISTSEATSRCVAVSNRTASGSVVNTTLGPCEPALEIVRDFVRQRNATKDGTVLLSKYYFHDHVLEMSKSIADIDGIRWQLALSLLVAWFLVFICLFKSVKSAGKVVYVLVTLPVIIIIVLLARALTLDGGSTGISELMAFDFSALGSAKVWGIAVFEAFLTLGVGWGGPTTMASYNRFHNNFFIDVIVVVVVDVVFSVAFAILSFAILGNLAAARSTTARVLVDDKGFGPWLLYVLFAESVAQYPISPVWSVLLYLMIVCIALSTQIFVMETVISSICDEFPERLRKNHRHVLSLVCFLFYVCGVSICTRGGIYILRLLDYFAMSWSLLIITFFECMAISWVYGVDNFLDNVKWMVSRYPPPYIYWKMMWKFVTPVLLMAITLFTWRHHETPTYNNAEVPVWAELIGWVLSFVSIIIIPVTAVVQFVLADGNCLERVRVLICPRDDWGPALAIHRAEQYPLQIPEGREAMRNGGGPMTRNDVMHYQGDAAFEEHLKSTLADVTTTESLVMTMPEFDRETAI